MIFNLKRLFSAVVDKGFKMVKCVPVMSLQHPKNISEAAVSVKGTDILTFLRREQRKCLDHDERWKLFDKNSPDRVTAGSVLKVTYHQSKSETARPAVFTGVLIAVRRHPSEPTFSIRAIVDTIGVEQLFPVFSPMISKIEVIKRAIKVKSNKAYWLRDNPQKASEFINRRTKRSRSNIK